LPPVLGAILIAAGFAAMATLSILRLRPLHPVQLWTIGCAAITERL